VDKIYRYIRHSFNLDKATTDDIVQEIFLSLPIKLDKFDNSRALEPRLFKVAHNTALDRIRKESKHSIQTENIDKIEDFIYKISSYQDQDLPENIEKTYKN
jgi:RNA polymerase sigma factor (sigma-70 family)